jgi:hypothetical protein
MAHIHGNQYQVVFVRRDGREELSEWLHCVELVAEAIAAGCKPQDKAYWLRAQSVFCPDCTNAAQTMVECPIANVPSPRCSPHDSRYLVETGTKSRYELDVVVRNRRRVA